jgi:hypothetical protein
MPRLGFGLPLVSSTQESPITLIEDLLWEDIDANNNISVNYQETRTNSVLHSQDATDAEAWTKAATSIDSTLYDAPNDTNTANAIKSNNTGSRNYKITQSSLTLTTGKTYTLSAHVKKGTLGFARIKSHDGSTAFRADFNLTTGAVTNTTNTIRTQVDKIDGDWYRCSITFQATATTSSAYVEVFACAASGDSTPNVAVSGVVLLYVWGFQLEENSEPSAYIKTTTSARTATEVLNDFSNVWDFDNADLMPEEDPQSEGAWETLDNLVLNGDYEELGSELVTNGTFDADSNWTKDANWSIANGKATSTGSGRMYQSIPGLEGNVGTVVQVTFDIVERTSGGVVVNCYGGVSSLFNTVGTHSFVTTTINSLNLYFNNSGQGNLVGSIDNISVKQVDPNNRWTLGTGWSIEDGTLIYTGTSDANVEQAGILTANTNYELTYTVVTASGDGNFKLFGETTSTTNNLTQTVGTHTKIFFTDGSNGTDFGFRVNGNTSGSFVIDNVTVREYAIQPQDV